jgi:hypothetical protein
MIIVMHQPEIDLFTRFLSVSERYFEYGMGGSTCLAAKTVKKLVSAVDSDPKWVQKVRTTIGNAVAPQIALLHVDIGATGEWGFPKERGLVKHDAYSLAITKAPTSEFDLCLVDGRFRVACFLQALQTLPSDAVIGIHDYLDRPHYRVIEAFARPIATCQRLSFFVRRRDANFKDMAKVLEKHRRDPA